MMRKTSNLPLLPGFSFDRKIGCERWHLRQQCDMINGKIPYLAETRKPTITYPFPWDPAVYNYPSLYPRKEHGELASWVVYDKQILSFDAYFYDTFEPVSTLMRLVKIHFYLEDGTLQVNEKKIPNCGLSQGTILSRRRIPFPKPNEKVYYELIDLNIGKSLEFYGRVYHVYDCDKFTRQWLHRAGVAVPDPIAVPGETRKLDCPCDLQTGNTKPPCKKPDKRGQFLMYDTHVLRFFGFWDDRDSEGGLFHKLILQYYLSDDTIDVREEGGDFMLARTKLPKTEAKPRELGESEGCPTLLNVLTTGYLKGRIVKDPKNFGVVPTEHYTDGDLLPGVCVNVFGRAVVLTSCDPFTQEYYKTKYGIDNFETTAQAVMKEHGFNEKPVGKNYKRELPPWNGFGSFEDSERNCLSLYPQGGHVGIKQLVKSRSALDSHILRFRARMISDDVLNTSRDFIVSFYLMDDTTSVFEVARPNNGFEHRMFIGRKEAFKQPVKDYFVSRKPTTYAKEDFWVGNVLDIDGFKFELIEADEYCLRYMEVNSQEFPKSNVDLILMKIGEKLRPVFKTFVRDYFMPYGEHCVPVECLANALKNLLGDDITPHEIHVIARRFAVRKTKHPYAKETLKDMCRSECRRFLFLGHDRLAENLYQMDRTGCGCISKTIAYNMCRGAKVPVDKDLLHTVVEACEKNQAGDVAIADLLTFFNPSINISATFAPFSHAEEFSDLSKLNEPAGDLIGVDTRAMIECLGFEDELKKHG